MALSGQLMFSNSPSMILGPQINIPGPNTVPAKSTAEVPAGLLPADSYQEGSCFPKLSLLKTLNDVLAPCKCPLTLLRHGEANEMIPISF